MLVYIAPLSNLIDIPPALAKSRAIAWAMSGPLSVSPDARFVPWLHESGTSFAKLQLTASALQIRIRSLEN